MAKKKVVKKSKKKEADKKAKAIEAEIKDEHPNSADCGGLEKAVVNGPVVIKEMDEVLDDERRKEVNSAISKLASQIYEIEKRIDCIVAAIDKSKSVRGL